jgi:hypothetical protein
VTIDHPADIPLMPPITGAEYLPDAVDFYDLVEIAEDLGLDPTPQQLEALRWKLHTTLPARAELARAA